MSTAATISLTNMDVAPKKRTQHFKDISSSLGIGTMMAAISEDDPFSDDDTGMAQGTKQCPSEDQVREILSNNGFKNASEIAKDYQKYVEAEAHEQETLMDDLCDPDGSWIADSELKTLYHWNNQQTTNFKQLVLKLMIEKQKAIQMRQKYKATKSSLMKKTKSMALLHA
eukprot:951560_1